jgi:hypothetical protein
LKEKKPVKDTLKEEDDKKRIKKEGKKESK